MPCNRCAMKWHKLNLTFSCGFQFERFFGSIFLLGVGGCISNVLLCSYFQVERYLLGEIFKVQNVHVHASKNSYFIYIIHQVHNLLYINISNCWSSFPLYVLPSLITRQKSFQDDHFSQSPTYCPVEDKLVHLWTLRLIMGQLEC